jgi:type 1 glutamine amidotransferase
MRKLLPVVALAAIVTIWIAEAQQPPAGPPAAQPAAQPPTPGAGRGGRGGGQANAKKRVLVFGMTKGFHHDSVSNAMASIWKLGKDSGVWDTEISTDPDILRKGKAPGSGFVPLNLLNFDAVVFASTTGEIPMDDQQKKDFMEFIRDDGKGFVGIHAALDTNYKWPEYGEMLGGWFDGHPWNVVDAPTILEDPSFPAVRHFSKNFQIRDEMYMAKSWSRDKVNVLLRMDDTKLDYTGKNNIRPDHDFALAWSKMHGKGRVFYSTLGHTNESWDDPDVQKMYLEAIKWVLRRTEGSTAPHPRPVN